MLRIILLFISLIIGSEIISAATLQGKVLDAKTGESLVGATIYIKELKIGTTSGLDGTYILKNVPLGSFTLIGNYVSYTPIEQKINLIDKNQRINTDFIFHSLTQELDEVVISAHVDRSTELNARSSEKNAVNIINAISNRTIELSPDLDVANVIQRMTGVTVERNNSGSGQYAILRGMDKRYNYTLVNGIKIPSTNNKYRYLPLDMFPSDMVERLEVTKALTPNMEGDAVGGVVNMLMKEAPDKLQIKANIAGGYNQIFIENRFLSINSDGIQSSSPYEIYGSNYKATESNFPSKNLDINPKTFAPNTVAGFSVGNRFLRNRLGIMLTGNYMRNHKGSNSLFSDISNTADETNLPKIGSMDNRFYSEEQTHIGNYNAFDYRINSNHKIKLYSAFIKVDSKQIRDLSSIEFNSYTPGNGTYTKGYETRNQYNIQQLISSTLQGDHQFTDKLNVNWSGVFSIAENKSPDNTKISLVSDVVNYEDQHIYVVEKSCYRRWTRNSDQDFAGYLNISYTPILFNTPTKLSVGGLIRRKERTSFYNQYTLIPLSERPAPFQYFSEKGVEWNTYSEIHWEVINPPDPTHPLNYDASEDISAGYFQYDFNIKKIQFIGGLRAEYTNQGYILHYEQYGSEPIGNQKYTDFLPSFHIKYKPTNKQNVRFSYFRGINRPGFLEIVPYEDKTDEYTEAGNANIKRAVADNYDIRYENFPTNLDQFMIGFFYKSLKNPIEYSFVEKGATKSIIYIPANFGDARNLGIEVDFIKYFRSIGVKANYTYTNSKITTTKLLLDRDSGGNLVKTFPNQTRSLFGQSEHMANLALIYRSAKFGWDAQLAASYTSDRIAIVSQYLDNDTWEKGSVKLDFSTEKQVSKNISLFIKINNLLNSPKELYMKKVNPDFVNYPGQDQNSNFTLVRRDYYMANYLVGLRLKFL